ncbi:hypothetical protein BDN72DRAFT_893725 [Pluteus cervinus]|uniref:Uncharacterized protein n=1 Tax=Pluteus cervinus TaxID=181527 RepID=A0ACD3B7F9_9AGAR|nr:hypothetical protein BDN72DRAFT_893725 [Pluteus cervinus]
MTWSRTIQSSIIGGLALAASAAHATTTLISRQISNSTQVTNSTQTSNSTSAFQLPLVWNPCGDPFPQALQCSSIGVPLDWTDASKGNITLAMIKQPASVQPKSGTIFMNPGGPGASGLQTVAQRQAMLVQTIGTNWDIVSWDPRGVGQSGPKLVGFANVTDINKFYQDPTIYQKGNLTNLDDVAFFLGQTDAYDQVLVNLDKEAVVNNGDTLKHLGTVAGVKDFVYMQEAIDGTGADLNYFGIGYGTLLGQYILNLYPDRIGKFIIDSVTNVESYAVTPTIFGADREWADIEAELTQFTRMCAAAGEQSCPLAAGNATADDINATINKALELAYEAKGQAGVTHNSLIETIRQLMYYPAESWPLLSPILQQFLVDAQNKNFTAGPSGGLPSYMFTRDLTMTAESIGCADGIDNPANLTTDIVLNEIVRTAQNVTHRFGSQLFLRNICHKWTSRAVERYSGPWNNKPKNVVLVIGNMADPITPFRDAKLLASEKMLGGANSRLVMATTFGHSIFAYNSTCVNHVFQTYLNGTPPTDNGNDEPDVVCNVETTIFGLPINPAFNVNPSTDPDSMTPGPTDPGMTAWRLGLFSNGTIKSISTNTGVKKDVLFFGSQWGYAVVGVVALLSSGLVLV